VASELYCKKCRRAQPVREHLLLVLPSGNKYVYRCNTCNESLGEREDGDSSQFRLLDSSLSERPR